MPSPILPLSRRIFDHPQHVYGGEYKPSSKLNYGTTAKLESSNYVKKSEETLKWKYQKEERERTR